ncbi:Hypothetical predicted protein [Lecanosticta acicola]|uniref:Uncharacterized protein n=1 Tax=Lecanosticta acicola TaxID=111012 RepID=A0AAI9EAP1_9PEZI|nr:Hypothetical predicted protein [Lecanosticta acicola]
MNERYPIVHISRPTSRQSWTSGGQRPDIPGQFGNEGGAGSRKPSVDQCKPAATTRQELPSHQVYSIAGPETIMPDSTRPAISTSPKQAGSAASSRFSSSLASRLAPKRPKSAYELRVNYKNNPSGTSKALEVHRKKPVVDASHLLEDSTIMNISAGPYASLSENTRPALPAISSSEWLATGRKGKEVRKASSMNPVRNSKAVEGGSSPGQRLVTSWLGERREKEKENSPAGAFV